MGAWFCTPCFYGRAAQRLDLYPSNDRELLEPCDTNCWLYYLSGVFGMAWIPMMLKREDLRDRFNIEGDLCTDCIVSATRSDLPVYPPVEMLTRIIGLVFLRAVHYSSNEHGTEGTRRQG